MAISSPANGIRRRTPKIPKAISMSEELEKEQIKAKESSHLFQPGVSGNPEGRKPDTEEQKLIKKAVKELVKEYQQTLAEALPKISPVLIKKAIEGDIQAIKELHDRAMGKSMQNTNISGSLNITVDPEQKKKIDEAIDEVL